MNLKQLYIFGMENSQEPVIKNPVLRAALEKPRTMAQAPIAEDLEPGSLRDEMLKRLIHLKKHTKSIYKE